MALNFDRLHVDPPPIGRDLGRVFVNEDPSRIFYAWMQLFYDYFGGWVMSRTEYRVLLAQEPFNYVYDQQSAEEWLQKAEVSFDNSGQDEQFLDESLDAVETAFGFWLFPVDAFGAFPEDPVEGLGPAAASFMDLGEYWPELGLLNLS
ncbi:hypothetical protein F4818DRAFT_418566 [Hypoxylon cercidicola]|nr:hypothetical protein F4818DRAFT_418566 [Hypoxylon cercidicola]